MYSEVFGYRINCIYVAFLVAFYDLFHISLEMYNRFEMFQDYENTDIGCIGNWKQAHCFAIYSELGIYTMDLIFTIALIVGAAMMNKTFILAWIMLSTYHLVDFFLYFTPFYGVSISFSDLKVTMWIDISVSIAGWLYVIYFFKRLMTYKREEIASERFSNVTEFNGVSFEAY